MKRIAFVGACFPEKKLNYLIENKDIDDIAANIFGQKICQCMGRLYPEIDVINEHKRVRFPFGSKIIVPREEDVLDNIKYHSYSYLNVLYLERFSKSRQIKKMLKALMPEIVIVYSMHTPYLEPVVELKKIFEYKIVLVVPDLPEYMMANRKSYIAKLLKERDVDKLYKLSENADGFIVLSNNMLKKLPTYKKKSIVLEGIADDFTFTGNNEPSKRNYILYTGIVSNMYGLPEFIKSYIASGIDEELFICGTGPFVNDLVQISKEHPKIKYLGVLNRNEVKKLQKNAALLINPRSKNDPFTMYSFPSKTMEYLASGSPVMMERLKGIPDKYYDYIIEVDTGKWQEALSHFSMSNKDVFLERAKRGAIFIEKNKTVSGQASRLKTFFEEL